MKTMETSPSADEAGGEACSPQSQGIIRFYQGKGSGGSGCVRPSILTFSKAKQ